MRQPGDAGAATADGLNLRAWFALFVVWMALLAATSLIALRWYESGDASAQGVWLLALGVFYLSLCSVFFPAPTAWIVMLLASNEMALIDSPVVRVMAVAGICSVATGVANLTEYHVITYLLRFGWASKLRESGVYRWASRWFSGAPFLVIAIFGFLPLPVDAVRWLAIVYRYDRLRYFAAYVVGRFPRYVIWAASAVWLDLNWWQILVFQAVLVGVAAAAAIRSVVVRRRSKTGVAAAGGELSG